MSRQTPPHPPQQEKQKEERLFGSEESADGGETATTEGQTAGCTPARARRGKRDQPKDDPRQRPPEDFPPALIEHARQVFRVLRTLAEQRGARAVTPLAVCHVMQANPGRHFVTEAHQMAGFYADRPEVRVKDVAARYRTWLGRAPQYAGVEQLGAAGQPDNVTPIRRRGGRTRHGSFVAEADRRAAARGEVHA